MSNNEGALKKAFIEALGLEENTNFETLAYGEHDLWDSVAHMQLIAEIEDTFEIMMDTDDVIGMSSFIVAKNILSKNYDVAL